MEELRDIILDKMKKEKNLTFVEICNYASELGFTEWDVATTLPALCKEGYLQKVTQKIKKRKLFTTTEETETRYHLR